jgi:hypothetical protein
MCGRVFIFFRQWLDVKCLVWEDHLNTKHASLWGFQFISQVEALFS